MFAVYKRELSSYFKSPIGYVVIAIFAAVSGFTFINFMISNNYDIASDVATLRSFFIILVPLMTMGLFAEDKTKGTDILYYTSPVSLFGVVMGKFFAAVSLFAIMFLNVILHIIITLSVGGKVDMSTLGAIIIYFFLAFLFISIGVFTSSLVDNQLLAAIFTFVIILFIQLLEVIANMTTSTIASFIATTKDGAYSDGITKFADGLNKAILWFDPFSKTNNFNLGIFSICPLIYCLSITAIFLYLTYRLLEKKRWTQK